MRALKTPSTFGGRYPDHGLAGDSSCIVCQCSPKRHMSVDGNHCGYGLTWRRTPIRPARTPEQPGGGVIAVRSSVWLTCSSRRLDNRTRYTQRRVPAILWAATAVRWGLRAPDPQTSRRFSLEAGLGCERTPGESVAFSKKYSDKEGGIRGRQGEIRATSDEKGGDYDYDT